MNLKIYFLNKKKLTKIKIYTRLIISLKISQFNKNKKNLIIYIKVQYIRINRRILHKVKAEFQKFHREINMQLIGNLGKSDRIRIEISK